MDLLLLAQLALAGIGVLSAAFAAWHAVRSRSSDAAQRVDELADAVDKLLRIARREQMRGVRAAAGSAPRGVDDGSPPPELVGASLPAQPADIKAALRRQFARR